MNLAGVRETPFGRRPWRCHIPKPRTGPSISSCLRLAAEMSRALSSLISASSNIPCSPRSLKETRNVAKSGRKSPSFLPRTYNISNASIELPL
jgi:hypothetical protein